ncbi:F0F1 ATP synthase subunit epsilon [Micropruina sp.]|uniref:F0F1 ATP synthase subunit epsilon n=1 Tax=Micropruina sp. TaxID=2737536 RepID=UPI0026042A6C|nr:F0F1 ATP synthase subunit epsilon [Micropruina sp.]
MAEGERLFVDVVAADRRVWEGEAISVIARTTEGDIGIMANHEPLLAVLVPCAAEILTADGKREVLAVDGGFISVADNRVSILSQYGRLAHEILVEEAERERRAAWKRMNEGDNTEATRQHFNRAHAQLAAAKKAQQAQAS